MGLYDPTASVLLYGMGGAGKTPLAVSSFWDWKLTGIYGPTLDELDGPIKFSDLVEEVGDDGR